MYNVIGDIAGNYLTLKALLKKMPEGKIVSVGDIVDRGPRSKEVVEFFMEETLEGNAEVLLGNHEHMMIDSIVTGNSNKQYDEYIWLQNGGFATADSFKNSYSQEVVTFLSNLKVARELEIEGKTFFISHAFKPLGRDLEDEETELFRHIWNRREPFFNSESPDIQICGHNSQMRLKYFKSTYDDKIAICIDTSAERILTGIHLPSMTIYQQEYID